MACILSQEEFLRKASDKHGNTYDYSKSLCKGASAKITITCKRHGDFVTTPAVHITGRGGCKECRKELLSNKYKLTFEQFLERAEAKHGDKYSYVKDTFTERNKPLQIICRKHGDFWQSPGSLLGKLGGCIDCNHPNRTRSFTTLTIESLIQEFKDAHKNSYLYPKLTRLRLTETISITCSKHGEFRKKVKSHLLGSGCNKCFIDSRVTKRSITTESFTARANKAHNYKFNYSKTIYRGARTKVDIVCPKHGVFSQIPNDHLRGVGCSRCGTTYSKPHQRVVQHLLDKGLREKIDFLVNDRSTLLNPKTGRGLELDIYFPSKQLAIEVDGQFFHGYNLDSNQLVDVSKVKEQDSLKNELCTELGISLIRISDVQINKSWAEVETLLNSLI